MPQTIHVCHPELGLGTVLEIRHDPLPPCFCSDCKANPRPSHLVLIQWQDGRGVAGGWYDPMDERFTFENAVAMARMIDG